MGLLSYSFHYFYIPNSPKPSKCKYLNVLISRFQIFMNAGMNSPVWSKVPNLLCKPAYGCLNSNLKDAGKDYLCL